MRYFVSAESIIKMTDGDGVEKASWDFMKFVQKTPCTRDSLLYGIVGGLTAAGLYFLKTSHVRRSCDVAVGSFALISIASWEMCRHFRYQEHDKIKKTIELMNKQNKKQNGNEPKETWQSTTNNEK